MMTGHNPIEKEKRPLFLCGDVMTGRGIDQLLPGAGNPRLHESFIRDARDYVRLGERRNGPIRRPVGPAYPWGDALPELERRQPHLRLINLETSITVSEQYWRNKAVHYRMHPGNTSCLTVAGIDCCALANNHVLDWGYPGLVETLATLQLYGIRYAGAGNDATEAAGPAVFPKGAQEPGRLLFFSFGLRDSGIPSAWAATADTAGVFLFDPGAEDEFQALKTRILQTRRPGDLVIASIHWGENWGYDIPREHRTLAHRLIDECGVDLIHGHSSHHAKGIEVYRRRLILYGCGDFITDYEGISGHEEFRGTLTLMYFPTLDGSTGDLIQLEMVPMLLKNFRLNHPPPAGVDWLRDMLTREGARLGTKAVTTGKERPALLLQF